LVESLRQQYGFGAEEAIVFRDEQTGQSWSTDPKAGDDAHQVVMLGNGHTRVLGGKLADVIFSGQDNDNISSGDGNDYLFGGAGDDMLNGGTGNDVLVGGECMDQYFFNTGDGQDKIYDFNEFGAVYLNLKLLSQYQWVAK
jgi:Ca2+-binding RTX toxin-like protein